MTISTKTAAYTDDEPVSFMEHWLIVPKALYFILNLFVYTFHSSFGPTLIEQWDLTYSVYGFITCLMATNFLGSMLWTSLADRTGKYKTILFVTVIAYTIVSFALQIPLFKAEDQRNYQIAYVLVLTALFNFFLCAAFPLVDAQIMGMLASNPRVHKDQFGRQRMFGAPGHLVATLISMSMREYSWVKIGQIVFQAISTTILLVAVFVAIPDVTPVKHGHGSSSNKKSGENQVAASDSPLISLFTSANFMFFMFFIMFSGIIRSVTSNYQKLLVKEISSAFVVEKAVDGKKSSGGDFKTALVDISRTISEMFVYSSAKYFIKSIGIYWVLMFSQFTGIIRCLLYGLIPLRKTYSYYLCFGIEFIKGFNSGLLSSSAIPIAHNLAPAGCERSAQGLYSGNYAGFSALAAGLICGFFFLWKFTTAEAQVNDLQDFFFYISIGSTIVALLLMCKYIFVDRVMGIPGFPRRRSLDH